MVPIPSYWSQLNDPSSNNFQSWYFFNIRHSRETSYLYPPPDLTWFPTCYLYPLDDNTDRIFLSSEPIITGFSKLSLARWFTFSFKVVDNSKFCHWGLELHETTLFASKLIWYNKIFLGLNLPPKTRCIMGKLCYKLKLYFLVIKSYFLSQFIVDVLSQYWLCTTRFMALQCTMQDGTWHCLSLLKLIFNDDS